MTTEEERWGKVEEGTLRQAGHGMDIVTVVSSGWCVVDRGIATHLERHQE
jgi:hypothetical protein